MLEIKVWIVLQSHKCFSSSPDRLSNARFGFHFFFVLFKRASALFFAAVVNLCVRRGRSLIYSIEDIHAAWGVESITLCLFVSCLGFLHFASQSFLCNCCVQYEISSSCVYKCVYTGLCFHSGNQTLTPSSLAFPEERDCKSTCLGWQNIQNPLNYIWKFQF